MESQWCDWAGNGGKPLFKMYQKCIPLSGGNAVRTFKLFKTQTVKKNEKFGDYKLGPVSNLDWAKVRVWAQVCLGGGTSDGSFGNYSDGKKAQ